jgi:L,D-peptidoglycan transpeptidase YkuD (ErfK/YbiS/YcfS/YnhG family)
VGPAIPVTVGRTGLAWGDGLQSTVAGPEKSEGDLKSPAGIYKFGKAFGYADAPPPNTRLPYQKASAQDFYVSDPASTEYNQWVNLKSGVDPHTRWASFEKMRRSDSLYELGIVVEYNMSPVVKGKGSAIFFHIWRAADAPTAGCTAMEKQHLVELLQWLDPEKAPLLIQVPSTELRNIRYTGKH